MIQDNLLQFSTFYEPVNFIFDQYLLDGPTPILVHTGPVSILGDLISRLLEALGSNALGYVFAAHFESDECGGLAGGMTPVRLPWTPRPRPSSASR